MPWTAPTFTGGLVWKDLPEESTPLDAANLNAEENAEAVYAALVGSSVATYAEGLVSSSGGGNAILSSVVPGATDSSAQLAADISAAIAAKKTLLLPPGTINLAHRITWASDWCSMIGQGKRTTLHFTSSTDKGLVIGPGSSAADDLGDGGQVGNFRITGSGFTPGTTTPDFIAGLTLDSWRFGTVLPVSVDGFDVGGDMIDNCYGCEWQRPLLGRYETCNLGLRVRTGVSSGDDIHFWNPWLGGYMSAVCIEDLSGDGTAGFYFHGGQYQAGGDATTTHDDRGALLIGINYQYGLIGGDHSGGIGGYIGEVIFFGGDFEQVCNIHNIRTWCPFGLKMVNTRFDNQGFESGFYPLTIMKSTGNDHDRIEFDGIQVGGVLQDTMLRYTPAGAGIIHERNSTGQAYLQSISAAGPYLAVQPMIDYHNLYTGTAIARDKIMLGGVRIRTSDGNASDSKLQYSTDGSTWQDVSTSAGKRALASHSASQTLTADGTGHLLVLDGTVTENDDSAVFTLNGPSAGTNPNTIQVLKAGLYSISTSVRFTGGDVGSRRIVVLQSNPGLSQPIGGSSVQGGGSTDGGAVQVSVTVDARASANDCFSIYAVATNPSGINPPSVADSWSTFDTIVSVTYRGT